MSSCEFCQKSFTTKYVLSTHQKTSKGCLKLQGKTNNDFVCDICSKVLCTKLRLERHYKDCRERLKDNTVVKELQEELNKKDVRIKELEKKIRELETNNKSFQTGILDLDDIEGMRRKLTEKITLKNLTYDYQGIAELIYESILKDENGNLLYVCTDQSRHIFKYTNKKGEQSTDVNAYHLIEAVKKAGIQKIMNDCQNSNFTEETKRSEFMRYGLCSLTIIKLNKDIEKTSGKRKITSHLTSLASLSRSCIISS